MRYSDALELQHRHGAALERSAARNATLLLLQHTPVFTLGRTTVREHLLCSPQELAARTGAEVIETDRGGSVTYHAPGQLTAYLLLNLQVWKLPIHEHLDKLEQVALGTLARFGISGRREQGMTGVWVGAEAAEKICAIGVSARRWVTYHGLSLNVDLDLTPFYAVVPCGLAGKRVTSMARVLQRPVSMRDVENAMAAVVGAVYGAKVESTPVDRPGA
ncbi:MAG: lipoyl(octanoyl) transferase LipB [Planctomycetota bacterium]|nr:lipoyl(octanoyl) transferase LipB [Planctomycetota bacterium]